MKADEQGFWFRHRTAILIVSAVLFLEPLALIFQVSTGDNDFCGTWCPRMFWVWRAGMNEHQFLLGLLHAFMGVVLVLAVLGTTFFLGRTWCSHLCPVGGATELGSRLVPRFLKLNFSPIPASPVRYGYVAVYVLAPIVGLGSLCCNYCSFAAIPRLFGAAFVQADMAYFFRAYGIINLALIVVLGFLAKGGRAYCNFLCPIGALDALSNRLGMRFGKRFAVVGSACNGCGECADACPTWAIGIANKKANIDPLSCFSCGRCQPACPAKAIAYGRKA